MNKHHLPLVKTLAQLPRQELVAEPTPLQPLQTISKQYPGIQLWCKRDDLISFAMGGNKIRGLELLIADAIEKKSGILLTGAGPQSNHVRATAVAASYYGLRCLAIFWGTKPQNIDGNLRITDMLCTETLYTGVDERDSVDQMITEQSESLKMQGLSVYAIPRGGACPLGALGHTLAAFEVFQQCRDLHLSPAKIVLATGSGGTHAGWLLATRALGWPWQIESYTVSREVPEIQSQIAHLATAAAELLELDWQFQPMDVTVHGGFIGDGYGIPSPESSAAIRLLAMHEGILLDPTYTGKAMAGLLYSLHQKDHREESILFIHTGGQPAFFAGDGKWLQY